MALAFLVGSVILGGFFAYTYLFPHNPYNPFPPDNQEEQVETPTFSIQPSQTAIIIPTATTIPTDTIAPTFTLTVTPNETDSAAVTPTLTEAPESIHFVAQPGTPVYAAHPNGCEGIYLVGNVIDILGGPKLGITVDAGGFLGGVAIDPAPAASGDNPEFSFSGWQIKLSDELVASAGMVFVALYDSSGHAISDLVFVDTYDDCDHNMIMVNFVQDR
jgi:hypothetical protein